MPGDCWPGFIATPGIVCAARSNRSRRLRLFAFFCDGSTSLPGRAAPGGGVCPRWSSSCRDSNWRRGLGRTACSPPASRATSRLGSMRPVSLGRSPGDVFPRAPGRLCRVRAPRLLHPAPPHPPPHPPPHLPPHPPPHLPPHPPPHPPPRRRGPSPRFALRRCRLGQRPWLSCCARICLGSCRPIAVMSLLPSPPWGPPRKCWPN